MKNKEKYNFIHHGDARNIVEFLGDTIKVRTTITSPPYYNLKDYGIKNQIGFGQKYEEYLEDLKLIFSTIYHKTEEDGSLWIVIDSFKRDNQVVPLPFDLSNKLKESGWLLQDIIIWKKDKTVPWSNNGFVQRKFEYILFFTKNSEYKYNKDRVRNYDVTQLKKWWVKYPERYNPKGKALDEIWEFPIPVQGSWGGKYIKHFCPLPQEMVATMIEISTDEGDIILDPFSGSGTVMFQSYAMNRKYIGVELNKSYIEMYESYSTANLLNAQKEYEALKKHEGQDTFRLMILNLRALKYGRLLLNEIEKNNSFEIKIIVEIKKINPSEHTPLEVKYTIIAPETEYLIIKESINTITCRRPFSKFGIKPIILNTNKIPRNTHYFTYTKTNSYAFSGHNAESPKAKIISRICVNLNENDYI